MTHVRYISIYCITSLLAGTAPLFSHHIQRLRVKGSIKHADTPCMCLTESGHCTTLTSKGWCRLHGLNIKCQGEVTADPIRAVEVYIAAHKMWLDLWNHLLDVASSRIYHTFSSWRIAACLLFRHLPQEKILQTSCPQRNWKKFLGQCNFHAHA